MEKKTAHYLLSDVKALVAANRVLATQVAFTGATDLGFNFQDMKQVIKNLEPSDFYKSMTSHSDHRVWQDVYHFPSALGGVIYLKLTVADVLSIVSFKER